MSHAAVVSIISLLALSGCGERSTVGGFPVLTIATPATVAASAGHDAWSWDGSFLWRASEGMEVSIPLQIVESNGMGATVESAAVLITRESDGYMEYGQFWWDDSFSRDYGWSYVNRGDGVPIDAYGRRTATVRSWMRYREPALVQIQVQCFYLGHYFDVSSNTVRVTPP
jgi:hypothetical protein